MSEILDEQLVYYTCSQGKLVKTLKSEPKGQDANLWKPRVNKLGTQIWEKFSKGYTGYIREVTWRESEEYGDSIAIKVASHTTDEVVVINIGVRSGYGQCFFMSLPNIKVENTVSFLPYQYVPKDKPDKIKSGLQLNQGADKVDWYYTRDNPNGLPPLVPIKVKGKDTFDDTDRVEFWKADLTEWVKKLPQTLVKNGTVEYKEDEDDFLVNDEDKMDF